MISVASALVSVAALPRIAVVAQVYSAPEIGRPSIWTSALSSSGEISFGVRAILIGDCMLTITCRFSGDDGTSARLLVRTGQPSGYAGTANFKIPRVQWLHWKPRGFAKGF